MTPNSAGPIFVVGCNRSGTTLVARMLACHPDISWLGYETQLFTHLRRGKPSERHASDYAAFLDETLGPEASSGDTVDVFEQAMTALSASQGATRWLEKTPAHLFYTSDILARWPGARIVHLLRDGRDVVTSLVGGRFFRKARSRRARLITACAFWEWMVLEGLRQDGSPNFLTMRYEDVVQDPGRTVADLAGFLELGSDERDMSEWKKGLASLAPNSAFDDNAATTGVGTFAVGRWRDREKLSEEEAALLNYLLGPTLVATGYEPEEVALSARQRAAATTTKLVRLAVMAAGFKRNVGYWPAPHLGRVARHVMHR